MEADYSSALTLLLRYPMPPPPHGPSSFVIDAVNLRENLSTEGGERTILKYSGKLPTSRVKVSSTTSTHISRIPRKSDPAIVAGPDTLSRSHSPMRSPAKFLQEQGGIEGILQEAARGVYSRGEKWGVGKALRGAVQSLQSGASSPRRPLGSARWSLDDGKVAANDTAHLDARIKTLEERNKALARMLENAMSDLWAQQKELDKPEGVASADTLSLAIAKIQFVQVYLEDSSIPLLPETSTQTNDEQSKSPSRQPLGVAYIAPNEPQASKAAGSSCKTKPSISDLAPNQTSTNSEEEAKVPRKVSLTTIPKDESSEENVISSPSTQSMPKPPSAKPQTGLSPFYQPRPTLAQSSFSWMLGEDKRKSSFISALPFPDDRRRESVSVARGKAGFLFGDEKNESSGGGGGRGGSGNVKGKEEREDEDGFTLGTLKGVPKGLL